MGFMDKLKDFGMDALKGLMLASTKSYGSATKGRHKLCKISLGNSKNGAGKGIAFIKAIKLEAEYVIDISTIKSLTFVNSSNTSYYFDLGYKDSDETTHIWLSEAKPTGNTPLSLEAKYRDMSELLTLFAEKIPLSDATLEIVNKINGFAKKPIVKNGIYGTISSGDYEGCNVFLGGFPRNTVALAMKGEIVKEYNLKEDIASFEYSRTYEAENGAVDYYYEIKFKDGKTAELWLNEGDSKTKFRNLIHINSALQSLSAGVNVNEETAKTIKELKEKENSLSPANK